MSWLLLPAMEALAGSTWLSLIAKGTLVFCLGVVAVSVLGRRSAALRHLAWTATLGTALAVAIIAPITPDIPIALSISPGTPATPEPADAVAPATKALTAERTGSAELARSGIEENRRRLGSVGRGSARFVSIWFLGSLAVLGWIVLGHLGFATVIRRAKEVREKTWLLELDRAMASASVFWHVRMYRSSAVGSPLTWGVLRPVIILPDDAETWSADRRGLVLAHELAHIARRDHLAQLLGGLACAVYWFNPLAWLALRQLRREAERACDDRVVAAGVGGADYAGHLLNVAAASRAARMAGITAIAMARPSPLEGRLVAVLDAACDRSATRRSARLTTWTAAVALSVPLAAATLTTRPALPPSVPADPSAESAQLAPRGVDESGLEHGLPASASAPLERWDTLFVQSLPAAAGERLDVDLVTGGPVVIRGWDRTAVEVQGRLRGADWRNIRLALDRTAQGVRVRSWVGDRPERRVTKHDFLIRVPRRFEVRVQIGGGRLRLSDITGSFTGGTGGGDILLEQLSGVASLSTGGGTIQVTDSRLDGVVATGGGDITMTGVTGSLRGRTAGGHVVRSFPQPEDTTSQSSGPRETGLLFIDRETGEILRSAAPNGAVLRTGQGDILLGRAGGAVHARTLKGAIMLGPVDGSVTAETGGGDVYVSIAGSPEAERSVQVTSGNGSVVVVLPEHISVRFDLETGYTPGMPRPRIESDWTLDHREEAGLEADRSDPRRYRRATGIAGSGEGLVRVRTLNGGIAIRRRPPS